MVISDQNIENAYFENENAIRNIENDYFKK